MTGLHTEQIWEAILKHKGEQKAGHGPWSCGHQSRADLRLLLEASGWPGLEFHRSQSQTPVCPHPTPAPGATHTLHTRYRSMLRGLNLHVNVAAHSRERTQGLVVV